MPHANGRVTAKTFTDIPRYVRVSLVGDFVQLSQADDATYGTSISYSGNCIGVKLVDAPGTHFATADGPVFEGQQIVGANAGRVAGFAATGDVIGIALETGIAGDVIEVAYYPRARTVILDDEYDTSYDVSYN